MSFLFAPPSSPFEPPSLPYHVFSSPIRFLVQTLYKIYLLLRGPALAPLPYGARIRLVCISDTHTHKPSSLPAGDVLIHAGDLTNDGSLDAIQDQFDWLASLPYKHVLVIAGNHDSYFDPRSRRVQDRKQSGKTLNIAKHVHYLQHSSVELSFPSSSAASATSSTSSVNGANANVNNNSPSSNQRVLKFYGAPQIPRCGPDTDFAFQYGRSDHEDAWTGTTPQDTDILITHTPPRHHLDLPWGMGCDFLRKEVWRVKPRVHICGHIHAGHGKEDVWWDPAQEVYERLCGRDGGKGGDFGNSGGILRDLFAIGAWIDVVLLILWMLRGLVWTWVWRGDEPGAGRGVIVNAAMVYRGTGKIGNRAEVVDI